MKTTLIKTLFALSTAACCISGNAAGEPYIGVKTDRVIVNVDGISLNYGGVRAVGGVQINPNLGIEGFVGTGVTDAKINGLSSKLGTYYGADLVGRLPVTEKLSVLGRVGYGSVEIDGEKDNDVRYGVGVNYALSKTVDLSLGLERWYSKNGLDINNIHVGAAYKF
ncbi:MAG TPA: porin family protein [Limnobacter sp.]|uniref:porin family protein n=1 Tax=Limnobacter sp. TaxID=2003368 RepID=UPI002EDB41CC